MDGAKVKKAGKRKIAENSDAVKAQNDINDGLELFVDAPRDESDDEDTTDSEESVYSGLEEEESTEDEDLEVMSDSEDETSDDDEDDGSDDEDEPSSDEDAASDKATETDIVKNSKNRNTNKDSLNNNENISSDDEEELANVSKPQTKRKSKKEKSQKLHSLDNKNEKIQNGDVKQGAVNEYSYDSSDEEDIRNTVGNIPMEWYNEYSHIGYGIDGSKLLKPKSSDELDKFLNKMDNPDYWRTVSDKSTGQDVVLSEQDVKLIQGIRKGRTVESSQDPYAPWIDFFTYEPMLHPVTNRPEHKRSFIPSKLEKLKVGRIVHAIKMGWIKPRKPQDQEESEPKFYMLWDKDDQNPENKRFRHHIPAPKMALPGHGESYNPPPEYLFTEEEKLAWNEQDPEDRRQNFVPQKFSCLRHVPAYSRFINERFERCLDLYLCPRQRKMKMNVDPEDLIPKLPKPRDLQPFPTTQAIVYKGHQGLVRTLGVHPTGQWLVSGSDDATVKFWEVATGRCMKTLKVNGVVKSITWNSNPALNLVAIVVDKTVLVMNPNLGDKLISTNTDNMIKAFVPAEDSQEKKHLVDWEECQDEEYREGFRLKLHHPKAVSKVTWHGKGDYFAVVMPEGDNMSTLIHQLSKRRTQNPFSKSKGLVQCVLFHPTRPYFFLATQRYVRVYNLLKQELTKKLLTNCKWVSSMAVHPGGDNLIIGSYDCRLSWFDLDLSTKPYKTLRHHKKAIRQVCYHQKYPLFASASDDGTVIICHGMVYNDLMQNPLIVPVKILRGHQATKDLGVLDCIFHPTQPWIFSSGSDQSIRLFT